MTPRKASQHAPQRPPNTVKPISTKALDLEEAKSAYQLFSPKIKVPDPDIREMDHAKILHTDIKKYLDSGAHITGIDDQEDFKEKKIPLQFKYSNHMKTSYGHKFLNNSGQKRQQQWNLDHEKRKIAVDYKPPKNFTTSYAGNFKNSKGTKQIGSYDYMVKADGSYGIDKRR